MATRFVKSKKTFGESSGRLGMPSERKPIVRNAGKRQSILNGAKMGKLTTRKPIGKAKVVKNGAPLATRKLKGTVNSFSTEKTAPLSKRGKTYRKTGNYYMSKRPKGTSPKQDDIDARLGSYFSGIKGGF